MAVIAAAAQTGEARGEARGRAEALLMMLEARGLPIDDSARARVLRCDDPALLATWIGRALSAASVADVLADAAP